MLAADTLDDLLADLQRSCDEGRALPAGCYTDEAFWRAEVEAVLRPGWHAVARADTLPEPGDYRSLELFGEPLLLVRDEQRRLRVFSRVCLHRAFPIVSGEGNTKRFTCPYHRWSYELDGSLCAAPFMEDVPGFVRDEGRLPELPLEEWQGFVFVSLDAKAAPLAPRLSALSELLDPWNVEGMRLATTMEFDSPWNWKVLVDNFMESYHHMGPHAKSLHPMYPAQGTYPMDLPGEFALLENPAIGDADPFYVAQVFPTFLFTLGRGETPFVAWYELHIDGVDHFALRIHVLLREEMAAKPEVVAVFRNVLDGIHREDIAMCDGVHQGLHSGLWRPGRLAPHEGCLRRFHRYLAERLERSAR